jgi:hypothetical protein
MGDGEEAGYVSGGIVCLFFLRVVASSLRETRWGTKMGDGPEKWNS